MEEAINKPDAKIFAEDLKSFLYLTEEDNEINLLIQGIKKFNAKNTQDDFRFGAPLMRLLYTLDKTDKAFELFDSKVL